MIEYDYCFEIMVDPALEVNTYPALGVIIEMFPRVTMTLTEHGFKQFREGLLKHSLWLKNITRVVHRRPEPVP
jgi:hypothetical protein